MMRLTGLRKLALSVGFAVFGAGGAVAQAVLAETPTPVAIQDDVQGDDPTPVEAQRPPQSLADFEAQLRNYYQYHAEADLLACLREATPDPDLRGTHVVGPRLKYLEVKQQRYADFRRTTQALPEEERQQVEVRIIELFMARQAHIEWARELHPDTTNAALLAYHETGCIAGLEETVAQIGQSQSAAEGEAAPSEGR